MPYQNSAARSTNAGSQAVHVMRSEFLPGGMGIQRMEVSPGITATGPFETGRGGSFIYIGPPDVKFDYSPCECCPSDDESELCSHCEDTAGDTFKLAYQLLKKFVDIFYDDPKHMSKFLASIELVQTFLKGVEGPEIGDKGLLYLIGKDRMVGFRSEAVLNRSETLDDFKREIRREFAKDLKEILMLKRAIENGTAYRPLMDNALIKLVPATIRSDADRLGDLALKDGWNSALKKVLPAELHAEIKSDDPYAIADDLETFLKTFRSKGTEECSASKLLAALNEVKQITTIQKAFLSESGDSTTSTEPSSLEQAKDNALSKSELMEKSDEEIKLEAIIVADRVVHDFHDSAAEVHEILGFIDQIKDKFAEDDPYGWHRGLISHRDLPEFVRDYKLLCPRGKLAMEKSNTLEEFDANLRKEFAKELDEIERIKQGIEDGSRYKRYSHNFAGLPAAIEDDFWKIGYNKLEDGWRGALKKVLPADLESRMTEEYPREIASELRILLETYRPARNSPARRRGGGNAARQSQRDTTPRAGGSQRVDPPSIIPNTPLELSSPRRAQRAAGGAQHLKVTADFRLFCNDTVSSPAEENFQQYERVLSRFAHRGLKVNISENVSTVEGPWHSVSMAMESAHRKLHGQGVPRVGTEVCIQTQQQTQGPQPGTSVSL